MKRTHNDKGFCIVITQDSFSITHGQIINKNEDDPHLVPLKPFQYMGLSK